MRNCQAPFDGRACRSCPLHACSRRVLAGRVLPLRSGSDPLPVAASTPTLPIPSAPVDSSAICSAPCGSDAACPFHFTPCGSSPFRAFPVACLPFASAAIRTHRIRTVPLLTRPSLSTTAARFTSALLDTRPRHSELPRHSSPGLSLALPAFPFDDSQSSRLVVAACLSFTAVPITCGPLLSLPLLAYRLLPVPSAPVPTVSAHAPFHSSPNCRSVPLRVASMPLLSLPFRSHPNCRSIPIGFVQRHYITAAALRSGRCRAAPIPTCRADPIVLHSDPFHSRRVRYLPRTS